MKRLAFWGLIGFLVVAAASPSRAADRIYTLVPDTPFDGSPFGFSGTIRTDGSTGVMSDVNFIKDWSITIRTPSDVDGIATEEFTRSSGPPLVLGFGSIYAGEFSLVLRTHDRLVLGEPQVDPTSVVWQGWRPGGGCIFCPDLRPYLQITDLAENPETAQRNFGSFIGFPFAVGGVAIPEPSTLLLFASAIAAIAAGRRGNARLGSRSRKVIAAAALVFIATPAHADIFQWEYINPADPSQGKQQSTTLAPDGAGVDAVPGAFLANRNLTMAYLIGADLTAATIYDANLTNADLSQANFTSARLPRTDFTGAEVRGANFFTYYGHGTGITLAQLYSTASYDAHDLTGIGLAENDLSGGNFAGQNLTNADLTNATLTDADFTGAEVQGANFINYVETGITLAQLYSTSSYDAHDLRGILLGSRDLAGGNFAGQNLTNAYFESATLTGADFTDSQVRGTSFDSTTYSGFIAAQLYSTASYQARDLTEIGLAGNDMSGWNFAGQNLVGASLAHSTLTNANFREANLSNAGFGIGNLTGANFRGAILTGAKFGFVVCFFDNCRPYYATLTNTDLTAADARGAEHLDIGLQLFAANTTNLIRPDGQIRGLELIADGLLVVRDYDGGPRYEPALPPVPITVDQHLAMGPGGTLRMVFEADAWDSTISFAPGIPVTLGGTLELTFAADVNPATQLGRTFDLFDWTGVTPTGALNVSSPYRWDLSNLYTTGQVTLTAIPEPATLALVLAGVCSLVIHRRRGAKPLVEKKETASLPRSG